MLLGTDVIQREFISGIHKDALAQLVDRGTVQIPLPSKPTKGDVVAFLRHYGLQFPTDAEADAAELLNNILTASGLRKLTMHLRDGAAFAAKSGQANTWNHFIQAHAAIRSLSAA